MRLIWHILTLVMLAALPLVATGCGGIQASKSVSPLDFFLPGIMMAEPPAAATNLIASAVCDVR